ncbi:MAG TPA: CBS domain-containing protein [Chitinophagaceae bacterium]
MINVREILDKKTPPANFIESGSRIIEALKKLDSVNLSYLVVKDGQSFRGIFCERDYCRNVVLKGRSSHENTVDEVMTVELPVVQLSDTAEHCMNTMTQHKTRYLLAFDGNEFRGVITIHDLLREVIASKQAVFDHLVAGQLIDHDEGGKVY